MANFASYVITLTATSTLKEIRAAFEEAKQKEPATIRLAEDVRWQAPGEREILKLDGIRNVWFDGNGKTITITDSANMLFHPNKCKNLIFSDFSVDYHPLTYALLNVIEVNTEENTITVLCTSNSDNPCPEIDTEVMKKSDRKHLRILDRKNFGAVKFERDTYFHDNRYQYAGSFENDGRRFHTLKMKTAKYKADHFEKKDRF